MTPFTLRTVNADVHSVHTATGTHIGNLKRVGSVWKFKAIGYDATGAVEPGGGPFTHLHNTQLAAPNQAELNAKLAAFAIR